MKLVQQNDSWVIKFGEQTVAIGGTTFFAERADAIAQVAARGLVVLDDGSIVKESDAPSPESENLDAEETAPVADVETSQDTEAPAAEQPRRPRGRPRLYTPEEAAERRREQNRRYHHQRKESRKAEIAERSRDWWQNNPDKVKEYRKRANEKRRERYANDPEYRAKVIASTQAYQQRKKAAAEKE